MSLFNNKYIQFSLYRDAELEAFYDIDPKYRRNIIYSHMMIHFLPALVIMIYFWGVIGEAILWQVFALTLLFYVLIILETVAYMFPSTRSVYKRYLPWLFILLAAAGGFGGYLAGISIEAEISQSGAVFGGMIGGFVIFIWTYLGMSLILKASRAIYTQKAAIEADVRFATEVQERILQDVSIEHNSSKACATSVPANELGGDFFELSCYDNTIYACIGDVSGHSFGAGLLMTMTKSALRTHLEYNHNPAEIMKALNGMFFRQSDRAMYATMCLLKLDLSSKQAELCNAGHLPVYHYVAGEQKLLTQYKKGMGLGLIDSAQFENLRFRVEQGDLLLIYSDGLIEIRDKDSKIRDADFFEDIVYRSIKEPFDKPEDLSKRILQEVRKADYSDTFEDDATLTVIQV